MSQEYSQFVDLRRDSSVRHEVTQWKWEATFNKPKETWPPVGGQESITTNFI